MHKPDKIELLNPPLQLDSVNLNTRFEGSEEEFHQALLAEQKTMLNVQQAFYRQKRRAVIIFEGWDASGKGGSIRRLTERLDPRGHQVHPIGPPSGLEQGIHYLYRFFNRLPNPGMIAIFDRSWYGRVLVERVEGLTGKHEWQRAYQEINEFERLLMDDGVRIVKLFLHIDRDTQIERFKERLNNPAKQWKFSEADIRNHLNWKEYEVAINDMLGLTGTKRAPWHLIPANHKWYAWIEVIKVINQVLSEGVDIEPPPLDKELIRLASNKLGIQI
ncbi:polyphosphate kinase [Porticoccaceae bacterium LTM1]|nr:polyphosphate kinase [Porticoccaceae bacterium LTM1]